MVVFVHLEHANTHVQYERKTHKNVRTIFGTFAHTHTHTNSYQCDYLSDKNNYRF